MDEASPSRETAELAVLVADDHAAFARAMKRLLNVETPHWSVELCSESARALALVLERRHHAVLLDWNFTSGMSGLEVCRRARDAGVTTPIVMLTMVDGVDERVAALDAGADDFLVKDSVAPSELCRRIEVAVRRAPDRVTPVLGRVVAVGPLTVHLGDQAVFVHGELVPLPKLERHILLRLAERPGQVVPYEELADAPRVGFGPRYKNLQNEVSRLRMRLGEAARCVYTVHGVGYRLSEPKAGD